MLAAPGLLPLEQCREDAGIGVHPGGDVDGRSRLGQVFLGACDRQEPGLALDQQVIGFAVAVRAVTAVAGDIADDDFGLLGRQGLEGQAEAGAAPGARFWTTTSACSVIRRFRMVRASGCLTSSVRLSLERFVQTKWDAKPLTRSS